MINFNPKQGQLDQNRIYRVPKHITIRADLLKEAENLGLNFSMCAEDGIRAKLKGEKTATEYEATIERLTAKVQFLLRELELRGLNKTVMEKLATIKTAQIEDDL